MAKKTKGTGTQGGIMNLSEQMTKLIDEFRVNGFNEVDIPDIKPECNQSWSEDYAIAYNFYYDADEHPYFDYPQFRYDLEQFIKGYFKADHLILEAKQPANRKIGDIVVGVYYGSQEIEVFRVTKI